MVDSNQEDDTEHIKAIIINVKNRIELCILHYLQPDQILETLQKEGMLPSVVNRVWEELRRKNREFFNSYHIALVLINQIKILNDLAYKSFKMLASMNSEAPLALMNHVQEIEPNIMQNNIVSNTWMNYQELQQQQPQMVFPPQSLTNPRFFSNMCNDSDPREMQLVPCAYVAPPPMNNNSFEGNIVANQVPDMSPMNNVLQGYNMTAMDDEQVPIFLPNENNHLGNMGNLNDEDGSDILALLRDDDSLHLDQLLDN